MANDHGGAAFLAFIFGGALVVVAVISLMMVSGRRPEEMASSKSADITIAAPASPAQPFI